MQACFHIGIKQLKKVIATYFLFYLIATSISISRLTFFLAIAR